VYPKVPKQKRQDKAVSYAVTAALPQGLSITGSDVYLAIAIGETQSWTRCELRQPEPVPRS
jgi:hypothetical protein